jgi:oligopeptide transport system substrate-binding protein
MTQTCAAGLFLALSLGLAITGCNGQTHATDNPTLRRGLGGEPSSLDPAHAADNYSFEVLRDLYEGLTTDGPNGEILPGVAKSWAVDPTGTEYTFEMRSDAEWSNGKPIVAQDFIDAWRRVVDPREASPVADDLRVIRGAAAILEGKSAPETLGAYAPSPSKLIVKLEKPAPYLPQLLTHSAAFPVYGASITKAGAPKLWVSNGPYVLSAWSPGTRVALTRNARYWDNASVHIKEIEYQIADENSQYARYRSGQLDITDSVPPSAVPTIQENIPNELVLAPFLATAYYGLNLSMGPFAENVPLRQSIAMAIDRKLLSRSLAFGQVGAYGFVPPGTSNYNPQSWPSA